MMSKFFKYIAIIASMYALPASAVGMQVQFLDGPPKENATSSGRVDIEVFSKTDTTLAGSEAVFAILLDIEDGWHLNAHNPPLDYLVGVDVEMEQTNDAIVSNILYPEPLQLEFDFAPGELLDVYEGETYILLETRTSGNLEPGKYQLNATVKIQACSDAVCLSPENIEVQLPLIIGNETVESVDHEALFADLENRVNISASADNQIASMINEKGYLWAFLGIFLIGLALNLTPCVYPMMSVTVSMFSGQQSQSAPWASAFKYASVYVLGMIFMYSMLGVVAAYTGELFGSWLQNPWVLAGVGVLIILLSLSMFGLYELQPPASLMQKLGKAQQSAGYVGHFLSGLLVGIFAAPCIGPPIIALLAFVGSQGNPVFGFFTFFVMALGLGLPYLLLGTFSGMLSKMPKSGGWMIWIKKVFGVVLVGVGLFYLALAFFPAYSIHLVLVTVVAGGIYLGFLEHSDHQKKIFRRFKYGLGVLSLITGFFLFQNLQKEEVQWEEYHVDLIAEAAEKGEPVMLDFYADWCIPCIELDRKTFTDEQVIEQTENFTRLKVDLTHFDSGNSEKLREDYNVAGVPTIIFLDKNGNEIKEARVVGFLNAKEFLNKVSLVH